MNKLCSILVLLLAFTLVHSTHAATLTVTTTADSGPGSLRQAITDANATPIADTITFNIAGSPPFKITPAFSLPSIGNLLILDGTTQLGYAGTPVIEIDGSVAPLGTDGLFLSANGGSTVRGLAVGGFSQAGIRLGAASNVIERCFIGTDTTGTQARGNGFRGIWITSGGFSTISSNLVSGNLGPGIDLGATVTNVMRGNRIGTDATGTQPLGNRESGVLSTANAVVGNVIGGTGAGQGNTIAFNKTVGVFLSRSRGNSILGNSIFANAGIGIELSNASGFANGPTRNDSGDFDSGGNNLQNFPAITNVTSGGGNTTIQGSLNSEASKTYRLEFFSNPSPLPKFTFSEGRAFIGFTNVTTDPSGDAPFAVTFPGAAVNVTATATGPDNNTSEFSTLDLPLPPATPLPGDIFVNIDASRIQWRRADGTPVKTLSTGAPSAAGPQGLALDRQGNLFATTVDARSVVKFDVNGNVVATITNGILFNTISVKLDAFGNLLVGHDNGDVTKFNPAGNPLATYSFGVRTPFDLAPDQQTLLHSPSVNVARRYDLANEQPLPDFTTLSGPQLLDIHILPDARVLLVNGNLISLHDAVGAQVRTFGQSAVPKGWGTARVLPDGLSFWVAGDGAFLNRFDLATGALLDRLYIEYQIDPNNSFGGLGMPAAFAIRGGFTAGNNGVALATTDAPDPVSAGAQVTYSLNVANNTASAVANATVTNTFPAGTTFSQATASQGSFTQGGGQVAFNLGTIAVGATANLTVKVTTAGAGTITNSARLTGTGLNPASPDYLSTHTTLVVNGAASPTTVYTTNDSGAGSLRKAIQAANNNPGPDTITFNIPGAGVKTIRPITGLPLITSPVTIDGYSQPGAQTNSLAQGHNGTLLIELDGSQAAGSTPSGLTFFSGSGGSLIRGLVINRFSGNGLALLANTEGTRIEGNFIGTDASGLTAAPNNSGGIVFNEVRASFPPTPETVIGGVTPDKRNVISGNNGVGVFVYGSHFEGGLVRIKGNYIGTDKTGTAALPNNQGGISVAVKDCVIGGTEPGAANIIAFNLQAGVTLGGRADVVPILHNSIHSNGALGIVGSFAGPQLIGAAPGGTSVSGALLGAPSEKYFVEVFANAACDPSGFGEGQTYIGSTTLTTDASGTASFSVSVSPALVAGQFLTATVTDENNDTSLFSRCLLVGPPNDLSVTQAASTNPLPAGSNVVFTITVSNAGPAVATGILLSWQLPANFTYVSGSNSVQNSSGRITASAASLAAGAATNWNIVVRAKQVGPLVNTFVVVGDQPDNAPGNNLSSVAYNIVNLAPRTLTVINTNTFGAGSLYQAIIDLNAGPGGDTIAFNISGAGVHTIATTFLTDIYVPVTIDGFTQPGSQPNSLAVGNNAVMMIEISGVGLEMYGGLSTVRGLVINGANFGIYLADPANSIQSLSNVVEGCFFGLNPAGNVVKPNRDWGIVISGSRGDRIGGSTPAARNVISGTGYSGVGLFEETRQTVIQGNYIGTDASGALPAGNKAVGIYSESGDGAGIMIGGSGAGQANVIAYNGGPGVLIYTGNGINVSGNSIFGNGGIGINLGGERSVNDAPRTNDLGDLDIGPNDVQNAPVITQVISNDSSTQVQGTLNSLPNRTYRLEFFSSPTNPAAFYLSEGKTYLGSTNVTTSGAGNAAFDITFPVASQYVSATATDPDGNTSPFFTFGYQPPAACFQPGDLLTGYPDGAVQWRRANGTPVRVLRVPNNDEATGMAFDSSGQLFVTGLAQGRIYRFDNCGNPLAPLLTGDGLNPESILFDANGNYLVGFDNPSQNVRLYDSGGSLLTQFSAAVEFGGADWIDVALDGHTLFYTSEGARLKRLDLGTSQQLPDLVTNLSSAAGVRVLPDSSVLVANRSNIQRRDAAGNLVRSYGIVGVSFWTSVNLDPDGVSFWSAGGQPPYVARFNIETGALLAQIPVDAIYSANSLVVMGETTAIGGGGTVRPRLTIARDGADVLLSWPDSATGFYLEQSLAIGAQANWLSNTAPPSVGGGQKTVRRSIGNTREYFRLREP